MSFCKEPCNESTFPSRQVKREQADMYWKCTGNIMIANCFEKKKVPQRTCHFNPQLRGSASAPSFVSPSRSTPSLTPAFGESTPRAVDQKQHLHYKGGESSWVRTAHTPPPLKWELCYPLHHSFKSILEKFIPFGPSWWIPLTGTFLLVPVSLFSTVRAVPWGFCHNNGSSEMVTEHHLTPRKMGLSHYF